MADRHLSSEERFWARVDRRGPRECWEWTGWRCNRGYGRFRHEGRQVFVHRFSYELARESIPDGLTIDHLCRNTSCVNPAHMEVVSFSENTRRARAARYQTHCVHGHEFTPENTRITNRGRRDCRACNRERWRRTNGKTPALLAHPATDQEADQ